MNKKVCVIFRNDEFLDKLDKSYQFLDKAILEKENE